MPKFDMRLPHGHPIFLPIHHKSNISFSVEKVQKKRAKYSLLESL